MSRNAGRDRRERIVLGEESEGADPSFRKKKITPPKARVMSVPQKEVGCRV